MSMYDREMLCVVTFSLCVCVCYHAGVSRHHEADGCAALFIDIKGKTAMAGVHSSAADPNSVCSYSIARPDKDCLYETCLFSGFSPRNWFTSFSKLGDRPYTSLRRPQNNRDSLHLRQSFLVSFSRLAFLPLNLT